MRLAGYDLNLLIALEALLLHRNVTLAAHKIGQSQPAMSRALARIRDILDDDLLVRGSSGLQLTARGSYLARKMPAVMAQVREVCFLRQTEAQVSLSVNEYLSPLLMPGLLNHRPQGDTPLRVGTHKTTRSAIEQLETRAADFVLGTEWLLNDKLSGRIIHEEGFVTLVAPETSPETGVERDREAFLRLTHARVMHEGEDIFPQIGLALRKAGLEPGSLLDVPDVTAAALVASQGKLALTVPQSIARWLQRTVNLHAFAPPVQFQDYRLVLGWLERKLQPSHLALLDRLSDFASATFAAPGKESVSATSASF